MKKQPNRKREPRNEKSTEPADGGAVPGPLPAGDGHRRTVPSLTRIGPATHKEAAIPPARNTPPLRDLSSPIKEATGRQPAGPAPSVKSPGLSVGPMRSITTRRIARQTRERCLTETHLRADLWPRLCSLYFAKAPCAHTTRGALVCQLLIQKGCAFLFILGGNPSLPDPPGLLVRFWTRNSSMIQLTKENEKSEPFSYWKKVRILCLWCARLDQAAASFHSRSL